jgi:hypothetical protein
MSADTRALLLDNLGLTPKSTALVRPRSSFIQRNKGPVLAAAFAGGALSTSRIDLIPFTPMGAKLPPSALAMGATFLGAILADRYFKRRDWALVLAAVSAGLGVGMVHKKIAERRGG